MSNEPKFVSAVVTGTSSSSGVAVPAATFGPTGRQIHGREECWPHVMKWAQLEDVGEIVSHSLNKDLTEALANLPTFQRSELTCYRGVPFDKAFVPAPNDMGPPPKGAKPLTGSQVGWANCFIFAHADVLHVAYGVLKRVGNATLLPTLR